MSALLDVLEIYRKRLLESADPCEIGEILREWAFPGQGYGCYSTFEVRPECQQVKASPREFAMLWGRPYEGNQRPDPSGWSSIDAEEIERIVWHKHPNGIEFGWHWDGDGTLAFYVPELLRHGILHNGDCKKADEWDWEPCKQDSAS